MFAKINVSINNSCLSIAITLNQENKCEQSTAKSHLATTEVL